MARIKLSRNPLSLDMGWKVISTLLESAFAHVAIRFRWIWVEKLLITKSSGLRYMSQSAFAGYGLKRNCWRYGNRACNSRNPLSLDMGWKAELLERAGKSSEQVAIRFRWIWVEKSSRKDDWNGSLRRNPLSLDMGWKEIYNNCTAIILLSQSAFAGYGLKSRTDATTTGRYGCRNPLSLDMGWKVRRVESAPLPHGVAIRFRWIWVEKGKRLMWSRFISKSQSAFAGYGLKRGG